MIVQVIGMTILNASPTPNILRLTMPTYIGTVMAHYELDITDIERQIMESITPLERWSQAYHPYRADIFPYQEMDERFNTSMSSSDATRALLRLNFSYFTRQPIDYISRISKVNSPVWEIGRPSDVPEWAATHPITEWGASVGTFETLLPTASRNLTWAAVSFSYDMPILRSFLWRGGIGTFMLALIFVIFLNRKTYKLVIPLLPIIITTVLLLMSIPVPDSRYTMGITMISLFFTIIAFFTPRNNLKPI